jgi:hypothetical protein
MSTRKLNITAAISTIHVLVHKYKNAESLICSTRKTSVEQKVQKSGKF